MTLKYQLDTISYKKPFMVLTIEAFILDKTVCT